ncbi:MAG: glyoxylase I family protein [Colwellia sp.]
MALYVKEGLLLKSIHHVAIICSDYEKSKYFYTVILGMEIIAENYRESRNSYKLDLKLPSGGQIELFSFPKSPERPSLPEALGLRHLAFCVESVELMSDYLLSKNIAVEPIRVDEYTHKKFTFFNDPDGLPLELYEQVDI